ncbi:MAG: DUF3953 domain-containing protein [Bacillota bacterium]
MLKISRTILAVIVIFISGFGLFTQNFKFQPYMMFFLSLMMMVMGLEEFQKERKGTGWIFITVFLFILFVSIQGFLLK